MDTTLAAPAAPTTTDDPTIWRVDDALWAELQPLLIVHTPRKKSGAPRKDDRRIRDGLIGLARTGAQGTAWPRELFGPQSTAHDRFQEWVKHGCLQKAWAQLLRLYDDEIGLEWEWPAADGCIVQAPLGNKGGPAKPRPPAPTPPTAARAAASGTR
jgi:transposase